MPMLRKFMFPRTAPVSPARQSTPVRIAPYLTQRASRLLHEVKTPAPSATVLRQVRAVEALERIRTAAARTLLEALSRGDAGARLTREASAALRRLQGRSALP